jgi:hypothetical protein
MACIRVLHVATGFLPPSGHEALEIGRKKELICNTAAHDKFLGRKHGQGFREEVCSPLSDEEIDERLGWAEA